MDKKVNAENFSKKIKEINKITVKNLGLNGDNLKINDAKLLFLINKI